MGASSPSKPYDRRMPQGLEFTVLNSRLCPSRLKSPKEVSRHVPPSGLRRHYQPDVSSGQTRLDALGRREGKQLLRFTLLDPEPPIPIIPTILQAEDVPLTLASLSSHKDA